MKRILLPVLIFTIFLLALVGCSGNKSGNIFSIPEDQLIKNFTDASLVEKNILRTLTFLNLTGTTAKYSNNQVSVTYEQPADLAAPQLQMVYISVFSAAQELAPVSDSITLGITIDGEPIMYLFARTEDIKSYREKTLSYTDFINNIKVYTPPEMAAGAPLTTGTQSTQGAAPGSTPVKTVLLPTVDQILFKNVIWWTTSDGYVTVYGLVKNDSELVTGRVHFTVQLLDANGNILEEIESNTRAAYILPGGEEYFAAHSSNPQPNVANIAYTNLEMWEAEPNYVSEGISIRNVRIETVDDQTITVGEMLNETGSPLFISWLNIGLLDKDGGLIEIGSAYGYFEYIPIDGISPFLIILPNYSSEMVDSHRFTISAFKVPPVTPLQLAPATDTQVFLDSNGSVHVTGAIQNNEQSPVIFNYALAACYDANGKLLEVSSQDYTSLGGIVGPGAVVPFDFSPWYYLDSHATEIASCFVGWDDAYGQIIGENPTELAVELSTVNRAENHIEIQGTVTNTTGQAFINTIVYVFASDPTTYALYDLASYYVSDLPAGGSSSFSEYLALPANVDANSIDINAVGKAWNADVINVIH